MRHTNDYEDDGSGVVVVHTSKPKDDFFIDADDWRIAKHFRWRVMYSEDRPYVVTGRTKATGFTELGRLLLEANDNQRLVYVDGEPRNLCRSNLRLIPIHRSTTAPHEHRKE